MRRSRYSRGTLGQLIEQFIQTPKFRDGLARSTQISFEYAFARAREVMGDMPVEELRPARMQRFIDKFADRPATQKNTLTAFRTLEKWAIVRELVPHHFTIGVELVGSDGAREPWSEDHVKLAQAHATPLLARFIVLAANTGQRAGDLVRMRWSDIETYKGHAGIKVTQQKNGVALWVPIVPDLQAAMDTWDRRPGFLVAKPTGEPWTRPQLSQAWYLERSGNPALAPLQRLALSFHGLRATAVIRWRRLGCTPLEIQSLIGMSRQMVERYSRRAEQRDNALAALMRLGEQDGNNVVPFIPNGKG